MPAPKATRPGMKDYGISTKPEGLMSWDWVSQQMEKSRNYWISSVRPDGNPHAAPVWGVWVDETFYFGTSPTSRKGRNFEANPNVVVHTESGDDTVIFEGVLEKVEDTELKKRVGKIYNKKYKMPAGQGAESSPMYRLKPKIAFSWLETDYPRTATRWQFED